MTTILEYRKCKICYNPTPLSTREFDYDWTHEDYDGWPDPRYGTGPTVEACKEEIDEVLDD